MTDDGDGGGGRGGDDNEDDDYDKQLLMCGRERFFKLTKLSSQYERSDTTGIQHSGNYTCHLIVR